MLLDSFLPKSALKFPSKSKRKTHLTTILKSISWRIVGTIDTIVISYFVTGKVEMALSIGFVEVFTKLTLFYLHERAWILFNKNEE